MALAHLTVVGTALEAEMLCGELRANDIESEYRMTDLAAGMSRGMPGQAGPTEVLVEESDLERARALLPRG